MIFLFLFFFPFEIFIFMGVEYVFIGGEEVYAGLGESLEHIASFFLQQQLIVRHQPVQVSGGDGLGDRSQVLHHQSIVQVTCTPIYIYIYIYKHMRGREQESQTHEKDVFVLEHSDVLGLNGW